MTILLVATWPQAVLLQRTFPFAQLTALRGLLLATALVASLTCLAVAWRYRAQWRFWGLAALALTLVAGVNVGIMTARGFSLGGERAAGEAQLTLLAWNTLGGAPGAETIARYALKEGADVLALTETTERTAREVALLMSGSGREMQVFALAPPTLRTSQSTALLVARSLGDYELDLSVGSTPRALSVVARSVDGSQPTLVATHTVPPLPTRHADWEAGLKWLAQRCSEEDVIVAGDLNATLDHFAGLRDRGFHLGACRDGAAQAGSAAVGTWPASVPPFLGSPIDHVLATEEWEFVAFRVLTELDGEGSDHRALLATLRRVR